MTDTVAPVVPIRPGLAARYGDTQAMNDIHALVTALAGLTDGEVAASVREIVARTGRPLARARMITAEVTEDRHGIPAALVDADGTVVAVGQDPDGPGVLVQVATHDEAESAGLVVTIDGRVITGRSPGPVADGRVRPVPRTEAGKASELPGEPEREGDLP
jgi:hypothetical protein